MSLSVANCPKCGKVYAINARELCPACLKELDKQYEKVAQYLRENRGCTINELSDETEVPVRQIIKFIREGRISIMNAPHMSYPCESCGTMIRESHLCEPCRQKLTKEYRNATEDEKRREALKEQEQNTTYNIRERLQERFRDRMK